MKRVVSVKTLEGRVWGLCKQIIRKEYPHVCISCGEPVEGKQLHTGHYFRKKFLPLQMKYDLRILRPQCSYCNLRLHGNLEWYTIGLMKSGWTDDDFGRVALEILEYKEIPLNTKEKREFLLQLEEHYKSLLSS